MSYYQLFHELHLDKIYLNPEEHIYIYIYIRNKILVPHMHIQARQLVFIRNNATERESMENNSLHS